MESWNGTDNIPLLDASGSRVAMVDAATGNIATNYTYDPLGSAAIAPVRAPAATRPPISSRGWRTTRDSLSRRENPCFASISPLPLLPVSPGSGRDDGRGA